MVLYYTEEVQEWNFCFNKYNYNFNANIVLRKQVIPQF